MLKIGIGKRIDYVYTAEAYVEFLRNLLYLFLIAEQRDLCDLLIGNYPCGLNGALLAAFRKQNVLHVRFSLLFNAVQH